MSTGLDSIRENSKQKAMAFIRGMKAIKFKGPRGKFDLDTFLLLTYNQRTKTDEIEFVSWAEDSSRIYPDYLKVLLSLLKLPKAKDHPEYPRTNLQYDDNILPQGGQKVPVIAFGTGPKSRTLLYRLRGMSTKTSFARLKKAAGLK